MQEWTHDLVSDFGLDTMEGSGLQPARLHDAILQAPFLDPYRVVFVRAVPANRTEGLAPALAHIPETTRLVITVAGKLTAANKLVKAIAVAGGVAEEMPRLARRALSDWATQRAVHKHGLTPAIAAQVVRLTPPELNIIDSEFAKLAAYKASGANGDAKMTDAVVAELLAGGREDEIFKLTDNLLPRPNAHAMDIARNLARGGTQPTSIAYRMARHIALVLEVKARQQRGESLQEAQSAMPEHPFVVQKAFDVAQQSSEAGGGAQFPGESPLPARPVERLSKLVLCRRTTGRALHH